MNFTEFETKFTLLTMNELQVIEGGGKNFSVSVHQVIDSTGRFFSGIYNAGKSFGRNFYNAFF